MTTLSVSNRFNLIDLPQDMIGQVIEQCLAGGDILSIQSLACTNRHFDKYIKIFMQAIKLEELCPLLKVISAQQAQECTFTAASASLFPTFEIIKAYLAMSPHVEGNAGVTYFNFTLPPDFTFRQIKEKAEGQGIKVDIECPQILSAIGDIPIGKIFPAIAANSVFNDSRKMSFDDQIELVKEYGCELPTGEQYLIHIVLIQKIFKQCLYGRDPFTFGRALTLTDGVPLIVGASVSNSVDISTYGGCGYESCGAGGWRKV